MKKLILYLCVMFVISSMSFAAISDSSQIGIADDSSFDTYNVANYFVNQEPDPVEPGEIVDVRWKIENFGGKSAENVLVEIVPQFPFSLKTGETAQRKIGSVWGRQIGEEGVIVHYQLKVDKNAIEGNNEINIRYSLDNGVSWRKFDPFYIRVQPRDIILNIDSVMSNPEIIAPGEKSELSIKVRNLANSDVKNVKSTLNLLVPLATATSISYQDYPFSPVGTSNEKTLSILGAKQETTIVFDLISDPDAESGVYKVPFSITYSDKLGQNYSQSSIISLIVGSEPDLVVSLDQSEINKVGQTGEVTVKFVNKGVTDAKFLFIKLKDSSQYTILSSDESYLGNVDSDDYETADFNINVKSSDNGIVTIPLHIEYKDSNNKDYAIEKSLSLKVYNDAELKELGLKSNGSSTGIIIIVIIVVAGVAIYIYRRRKKKKRD